VYLKEDTKVRIHTIGNINVWCSIDGGGKGEIQLLTIRNEVICSPILPNKSEVFFVI
jgi:hypothetical protein